MIAQTLTADIPPTGIAAIDRLYALVVALSAVVTMLSIALPPLVLKIISLWDTISKLRGAARSAVAGVEASRDDLAAVVVQEMPGVPLNEVNRVAGRLHDAVTTRVERVSTAAGTEPTLKPIVREVTVAMQAMDDHAELKESAGRG